VIRVLRVHVVALLAVFGALTAAASYVFGAPVSVALLLSALALVAVVTLCLGTRLAAAVAVVAAAGFLYVQLAGVASPLVVDFGNGSRALDLPTLLRGGGATWLPTLLGVAALLIMLPVAGLLRHDLNAGVSAEPEYRAVLENPAGVLRAAEEAGFRVAEEASPSPPLALAIDHAQPAREAHAVDAFPLAILRAAHEAGFRPVNDSVSSAAPGWTTLTNDPDGRARAERWSPQVAALVRISLGPNPDGRRVPRGNGNRLADMVWAELGEWREDAVVKRDAGGDVLMLLPGADNVLAHALVHRLEDTARRRFRRPLASVVLALDSPGLDAEQTKPSELEMRLEGRPTGARESSRAARGGG
jgi:hypothetical protein